MSDSAGRQALYEEFLRRIAAALRGAQLYPRQHPLTTRTTDALLDTLLQVHVTQPTIAIGIVGDELIVGDLPLPKTRESMADFIRRLQAKGIERIAIDKGVERDEIVSFIEIVAGTGPARPEDKAAPPAGSRDLVVSLPHIRAGKIKVDRGAGDSAPVAASLKRLYDDAVTVAEGVWDTAGTEGQPDLRAARSTVDTLADAVSQNRTALLGLTAMQRYDNYTFTHMVNVSILTMGQARALGIEGRMLREVGLSGLMHDIGKVRTPLEVLNKTEKLNDAEFAIMKRHTIEGAEILRRTPEMPALAPVVAFEHHMRLDGNGYPEVPRKTLNLGTMLCAIADVYDAMRSQRVYQEAYPTERILSVLKRNDGQQFDQHLVRRFVQLLGIYPPGNLVRLSSGEIAIVIRTNVGEPYQPRVLVLFDTEQQRLETPFSRDLWESQPDSSDKMTVVSPLDPAQYGIDPLTYL